LSDTKRGPIQQVGGNVGGDPEDFESKAGPGTRFSLARPLGYGDDAPPPRWISVAVWNEELREQVHEKIKKGSRVYVEGTITTDTYQDKPQYKMNAVRIGLIEFFKKTPKEGGYQPKAKAEKPAEEELDW
jgi:single-stranded DNA-binding protein